MRRSRVTLTVMMASAVMLATASWAAELRHAGSEFRVNTYTTNAQYPGQRAVAMSHDGSFVVTWMSYDQGGPSTDIYAQRHAAGGAAVGTEFRVNVVTAFADRNAAVASAGEGSVMFVWEDASSGDLIGRVYDETGTPVTGDLQVNSYTTNLQYNVAVGASDDEFVVVWESVGGQDGDDSGIFAQLFTTTGVPIGGEFGVNQYTPGAQRRPAVDVRADGSFVVVWDDPDDRDGNGSATVAQRFAPGAVGEGTEFVANSYTPGGQAYADVAVVDGGGFVVVWSSYDDQDGDAVGIFGRRFDAAGTPQGTEFQANVYTTDDQRFAAVAASGDGSFVVTWASVGPDGDGEGVFARRFDAAGTPEPGELQVNSYTTNDQSYYPSIAGTGTGAYVVAWGSYGQDGDASGVFAQRLGVCGDGFLDASEECDDGNQIAGDCCAPDCTNEAVDSPCDDGNSCTTDDACDGLGQCLGAPPSGCSGGARAAFSMKSKGGGKDALSWKLLKGGALQQIDLGDPLANTTYSLCVFDSQQGTPTLATALVVPPSSSWRNKSPKGLQYKDRDAQADGVQVIKIRTGEAGKSKIQLKARGSELPTASPIGQGAYFAVDPELSVVLANDSTQACWETKFTSAKKNTETSFKAKAP